MTYNVFLLAKNLSSYFQRLAFAVKKFSRILGFFLFSRIFFLLNIYL